MGLFYKCRHIAAALVLAMAATAPAPSQAPQCLKIGVLPLLAGGEQVQAFGQAIFATAGQCVEFIVAPVRRAEALTLSGKLDGELLRTTVWAKKFQDKVIYVPTPLYGDDVMAVSLTLRGYDFKALEDLKGHRVLITGGNRWAEAKLASMDIEPVKAYTTERYLELIRLERADVGLTEKSGLGPVANLPDLTFQRVGFVTYHIVLRHEHRALVPLLDRAVRAALAARER